MNNNGTHQLQLSHTTGLKQLLPRRIALIRALPGLGDMLCAVPAWRALRAALPQAHITLVGLPWAASLIQRFHRYLDSFLELPGFPGLPEQPPLIRQLPAFLARVQDQAFDLAIQMHGSGIITNPLTALMNARLSAGFYLPGQYCPDERYFLPYPDQEPEVRRHLGLMEFLGIPSQGEALEFPLYEDDWQALAAFGEAQALSPGRYVCLHPGASTFERCWPPERFAAVGDALAAQGLSVVLTGTTREMPLTQAVARAMRAASIDLAGRTSLGALGALLSRARLVVCNDTGVSHLAAALQVPSVVIFTQSDPRRWAPLDQDRHRIIYRYPQAAQTLVETPQEANCLCLGDGCLVLTQPLKELSPMSITVEMVMVQVESLLGQTRGEIQ